MPLSRTKTAYGAPTPSSGQGWALTARATSDSDVDLLVDFPAGELGLYPLLQLADAVENMVGRPVDVAAVEVMAAPVRDRALAGAVPL
jgi:predicted nucleotidyltransferase